MVYDMPVISAFTRQHKKHLSRYILTQFMEMCRTLVINVIKRQLRKVISKLI